MIEGDGGLIQMLCRARGKRTGNTGGWEEDRKIVMMILQSNDTLFFEIDQYLIQFQFIVNWKWVLTAAILFIIVSIHIAYVTLVIQTTNLSKSIQQFGLQRQPKESHIHTYILKTVPLFVVGWKQSIIIKKSLLTLFINFIIQVESNQCDRSWSR